MMPLLFLISTSSETPGMPMGTAIELAESALAGSLSVAAYVAASREMQGAAAAERGSLAELQAAFRLMRVAWAYVLDVAFNTQRDQSLDVIDNRLGETARQQLAAATSDERKAFISKLHGWLQAVAEEWQIHMGEFRQWGGPALQSCSSARSALDSQSQRYAFEAGVLATLARMPLMQRQSQWAVDTEEVEEDACSDASGDEAGDEASDDGSCCLDDADGSAGDAEGDDVSEAGEDEADAGTGTDDESGSGWESEDDLASADGSSAA